QKFQISNRQPLLLEFRVTDSKQTTAPHSNRQEKRFSHSALFRPLAARHSTRDFPHSCNIGLHQMANLPSIVIVGRPNVGKSTLFNRLTGTRRSIVTNEPGITRDRIYGAAVWEGRPFEVVDTGGIVPDDRAEIPAEILRQARVAISNATRVVLVVDARTGPVPLDEELALLLRRAGKPPVIAANKVDTPQLAAMAAQFYELGDEIF